MLKVKWIAILLAVTPLTGCYRPLFDENLPRNQFAQHDQARGGSTPMEETDAFGTPQPALRQRLMKE